MKKVILFSSLLALFIFSFSWAYRVNLGTGDGLQVELVAADASRVRVEIRIPEMVIEDKMVEGKTYQLITIPGGGWLTDVGDPQLPLVCRFVALPPTSGVRIEVIEEEKETLSGTFLIYPFQKPPIRGDNPEPEEFQVNEEIYSQDRVLPGKLVEKGEISILRDLRLAPIKFFPVQFNPQTGEVTVYKRLVVDIYFEGTGENPQLNPRNVLTRSFLKTYESFVLNFDQIKGGKDVVDGSILIITYDNFHNQVQPLADWKHKTGRSTHLVDKSTIGSTNTQIYNYIYNAYHTWPDPPEYVILVGDVQQIPTNNGLSGCITDHKYVTVDGSDYFADIHIGRISVQTQAEATHVISKTLNYRKNPYVDQTEWFMRGMTISGSDYVDDYNALICGQFMVDYAGFTYFDSLWASLGNDTPTQITNRLNQGRSWIAYFGHGWATGWSPSGFDNSDINALNNGEKLPAIFSVACNNGEFDYYSDCFAEKWIKVGSVGNEKGAVIICASTRGSSFFYSDSMGRGTFKAYFKDSVFHFTAAVNQGKMFMYTYFPEGAGGTTEREMQMYTTFGDPELDPWTAVPENLDVTHPDFVLVERGDFTVTVELSGQPLKNALVCLIKDSEVYQSAWTGPDGQVTLNPAPDTPGIMDLTVTGHNAYPYETTVEVISLSGPYLVYRGHEIDDDSLGESQGNDDGDVDIGETIELPVMLENLGDSTGLQVNATLSTTHPLITIIDDYEEYPDIPAGDSAFCLDDFDFWVSPEIPDEEIISFNLDITAENGSGYWNYPSLDIVVHAPVLAYMSNIIDDIWGDGDGKPDPGETCIMDVVLENSGSQGAVGVEAELISDDFYVTVTSANSTYPDIPPEGSATSLSSYQFQVRSDCPEGHLSYLTLQISAAGSYSVSDTFRMIIGQMPILFVDDDGGKSYESYFIYALDSVGSAYDVWTYETQGCPPDSVLEFYQVVVWSTGDDYGSLSNPKTLTATDQARLITYLDNGGCLFFSSQDFLLDNNPNTFITDYLHVAGHDDDETITSVAGILEDTISDGMSLSLSYPFYNFSDHIVPGAGAVGIFYETSKAFSVPREGVQIDRTSEAGAGAGLVDYCALRYPASGPSIYKVVFFSFPFEAVPQTGTYPNNSYTLMRRITSWFGLGGTSPQYMHGDANGDQIINLADVVYLITYLFKDGPAPIPLDAGDVNCDGEVNLADVVYLINYLYRDGLPPPC
ncbi:MAG: hypothetical protein KAW02_01225 [candidate division Zixibacteria bacterium]|nr:hypothetical protein [candidate division Zixibacteria bacterium]